MSTTEEMETAVLKILTDDPGAWFNAFEPSIVAACMGSIPMAEQVCRSLRRRKKIDGEGRGKWARYGAKLEC